jgi:hypothetical protein
MTISSWNTLLLSFVAGIFVTLAGVYLLLKTSAKPNHSAEDVANYRSLMEKVAASGLEPGGPGEKAAISRLKAFLQGIGDAKFVRENTLKVYAADAHLNDTLVIHHGAAEIEAYFVKTSETMTSYHLTVDDVAKSGNDYYIRWTMVFTAPALGDGKPVHSVGISQVRFNREGKVEFHQDFWDSGKNFFGQLPLFGGAIEMIRKRMESN